MKYLFVVLCLLPIVARSQTKIKTSQASNTSIKQYKKRILDAAEIDVLASFYKQDGDHASVTGGIGSESLTDAATDITVSIPVKDDNILSINATVSAYTSASSSNLNPWMSTNTTTSSGASQGGTTTVTGKPYGSPWITSTGASRSDVWFSGIVGYSHSSDNRNNIYDAHLSFANEFDYTSFGGGIGYTGLFNQKNTEINLKASAYLDHWRPQYPTEIKTYHNSGGNLNTDFFRGVDIYNSFGQVTNKNNIAATWSPFSQQLIPTKNRNTFSFSLNFSQVLTNKLQLLLTADFIVQQGWLANPMQRVYFADRPNYYIGNKASIPNYTSRTNKDVFQLADDFERLPQNRIKIPLGARLNYYINEYVVFRAYYRYYTDDWGIKSHTFKVETPLKLIKNITLYPSIRIYNQTAATYFAPYEQLLSTSQYYTSDYDLSKFSSIQYSLGATYTDIFLTHGVFGAKMKNISVNFAHYQRNSEFRANIISIGAKFILN